ncbi:hypothetical protein Dsin_011318 [Dipteronia sinensis]|uniref:RNase H type-1 domain-containing protein n=1 Tax=Dipteronia sinensis TaxID=43782 RepID=A0AAE0AU53_9ROSI|nr:hypothetical protein Dsin_011318 [Dipteronia sinensis]
MLRIWCPLCGTDDETTLHALWGCRKLKYVRGEWWPSNKLVIGHYETFIDFIFSSYRLLNGKELQTLCVVFWRVWCLRNAFIHERKRSNVWDILSWSKAFVSDRYPATGNSSVQASLERVKWKPPDQREYKINCKVVIHRDCGWIGFGIVIRDSLGLVMASCSVRTAARVDSWAANALVIRNGIQFGNECGLFPFSIESDAKRAVDEINKSTHLDSNYGSILLDIASLLALWRVSGVKWAPAACNKVAFGLAKEAISRRDDFFWMEDFPQSVRAEVYYELQIHFAQDSARKHVSIRT